VLSLAVFNTEAYFPLSPNDYYYPLHPYELYDPQLSNYHLKLDPAHYKSMIVDLKIIFLTPNVKRKI
jgi:hypothetical protein